eukprot:1070364-Rhodomonas_salina.1
MSVCCSAVSELCCTCRNRKGSVGVMKYNMFGDRSRTNWGTRVHTKAAGFGFQIDYQTRDKILHQIIICSYRTAEALMQDVPEPGWPFNGL